MPPVTRRASRAPAPGFAPLPRTTGLAAASASAPRGTPLNTTEDCSICFSDLSVKRVVSLENCAHHFHESCARRWAETRDCQHSQTCPVCRAPMSSVVDVSGNVMSLFPFGSIGEPTRERMMREYWPDETLHELIDDTQTVLTRYENLERDESKGEEYSEDVQSEKDTMAARRDTLVDLKAQFERGEWAGQPLPARPGFVRMQIGLPPAGWSSDSDSDEDVQPIADPNRRIEIVYLDDSDADDDLQSVQQPRRMEATRHLTTARRRFQQPTPPTRQSARIAARAVRGVGGAQQEQRQ